MHEIAKNPFVQYSFLLPEINDNKILLQIGSKFEKKTELVDKCIDTIFS